MIKTVELNGSYHEIGRDWGAALQNEMHKVIEIELGIIAKFYGIDFETVVSLGKKYLPIAKHYDPEFMEVLTGFAKGADVDFNTLFAVRTQLEILFYTNRQPAGMCTSFAIAGNATLHRQTLVGQNIDWHPDLPMILLRIKWPNGVKQLSLSMGGIWEYSLSSHAGATPYGVVATLTATPDEEPGTISPPISIVMNKASRQKNMMDAFALFADSKSNLASFLMADGKGKIKGIELGLRSFEVLKPKNDLLVHANHYVSDRYLTKDLFLPYVPDSPHRYEQLIKLIMQDYGEITPAHFMEYLSDHENYPKGLCAHVDPTSELPPSATLASIIMVPEKEIMYISSGNPCKNEFVKYDLTPK